VIGNRYRRLSLYGAFGAEHARRKGVRAAGKLQLALVCPASTLKVDGNGRAGTGSRYNSWESTIAGCLQPCRHRIGTADGGMQVKVFLFATANMDRI
jgi:hypothetical protein